MNKPRVFWFHYNRPASRAAGEPRVSLHYQGKCIVVNNVIVKVPTQGRSRNAQPHFVMTGKCNTVLHDTEPDGIFQELLVRAFKGKNPLVPDTPQSWQLYSDHAKSPAAAKRLTKCALACMEVIGDITLAEAAEVEVYLHYYCWRVDW